MNLKFKLCSDLYFTKFIEEFKTKLNLKQYF